MAFVWKDIQVCIPSRAGRAICVLALALALASCAALPDEPPRGAPGQAMQPRPEGSLAALEETVEAGAKPGESGFRLLEANSEGLHWRLVLIDEAEHSLDLQYYVWWGDEAGELLMSRVVDAAERGVKVRLILDDLSTMLKDERHPKLRDAAVALVDSHPNIEVRVFNPWHRRPLIWRAMESLERLERLNHRMHNKQMIADNRAVIVGGRNIGNEYLGLSPEFNFRDLDVLGVGPVARQSSAVFDRYWNSHWVIPVDSLSAEATVDGLRALYRDIKLDLASHQAVADFVAGRKPSDLALGALLGQLHPGLSYVHTDKPDETAVWHHMPSAIRALLRTAEKEVMITNAYLIPTESFVEDIRELVRSGVTFRILTNSLASQDVAAVNSHYKQWRRALLEAGAELYEIRHDAAISDTLADTAPVDSEFMGLHVKAIVIDRARVFIGSMNLDPRSFGINSEMGVVVNSLGLAEQLAQGMLRDMEPENSWRLALSDEGGISWTSDEMTLTRQPARNFWQRIQDLFFMAFPSNLY